MKTLAALLFAMLFVPQITWAAADCKPISQVKQFYQLGQKRVLSGKIVVKSAEKNSSPSVSFVPQTEIAIESNDNPYQVCTVQSLSLHMTSGEAEKILKLIGSKGPVRIMGFLAWTESAEGPVVTLIAPRFAPEKN